MAIGLLGGCGPDGGGVGTAFVDTLDPDGLHVLVSSDIFLDGAALVELRPDLSPSWVGELEPESGALGAVRLADGDTVFPHVQSPPAYVSAFERMGPDGELRWSLSDLTLIGFSHGVQVTRDGTYIGLDTVSGRIIAFDEAGALLWSVDVDVEGVSHNPNGLSVLDDGAGPVLIATTLLERSGSGLPDLLALWEAPDAQSPPVLRWRVEVADRTGDGAWPHGPRLAPDGTLTACHSANGQIVGYDPVDGTELWRLPETGEEARFAFPRDALFLEDGSLLVADAAAELIRIADPFGASQVVGAVALPGLFGLTPIPCGPDGGLPCLGDPQR